MCSDDDYCVVPTNVPMDPRHWIGHTIPGQPVPITHFDDALKLFTKHHLDENLPFPPGQPFLTDWLTVFPRDQIHFVTVLMDLYAIAINSVSCRYSSLNIKHKTHSISAPTKYLFKFAIFFPKTR